MSKYKPSLIEKETIILFNEEENEAEIYTYNRKLIAKLKSHPTVARLKRKDDTGAYTFTVPKQRMSIVIRNPISEEHRKKLSEHGKRQVGKGVIYPKKEKKNWYKGLIPTYEDKVFFAKSNIGFFDHRNE